MPISEADLIQIIGAGERIDVEFKSDSRRQLSDDDLILAVVCMANLPASHDRGWVVLGVEDDGKITGCHRGRRRPIDGSSLDSMIRSRSTPPVQSRTSVVEIDERDVVVIEVHRSENLHSRNDGLTVQRVAGSSGPECLPVTAIDASAHRFRSGRDDYTAEVAHGMTMGDLDPVEIDRLRSMLFGVGEDSRATIDSTADLLRSMELVSTVGSEVVPTVAAVLLVGREEVLRRSLPTHEVRFQVFGEDQTVRVNESHRGPLLQVLDSIQQRFDVRNQQRELMHGLVRLPIPDYEPLAFREALNNAVLHRDYTINNAIHLQWRSGEIAIMSPGGFLPGITADNILSHEPRPRNRRLADAFQILGLVERAGLGVDRIFEGQLRYGRMPADYSASSHEAVRLSLPGGDASIALIQLIQQQRRAGHPFSLEDLISVDVVRRERRADVADLARAIQRGESRAHGVGEALVERGIFEAMTEGRRRVYRFSSSTYRSLGLEVEYVRTRGFDRIQRETMVLEFLDSHGAIRRPDVVELCQIGEKEATRFLGSLAAKGKITKHGDRRGTWYSRSELSTPGARDKSG